LFFFIFPTPRFSSTKQRWDAASEMKGATGFLSLAHQSSLPQLAAGTGHPSILRMVDNADLSF